MRELLARIVCLLTVLQVVALAHVFATRHNPRSPRDAMAEAKPAAGSLVAPRPEVSRGQEIYGEQGCSACHAIAGSGNPRNALDGVGSRRSRAELREWITGTGGATEQLAPAVVKRKQRYQSLPPAELENLVTYLATLTAEP